MVIDNPISPPHYLIKSLYYEFAKVRWILIEKKLLKFSKKNLTNLARARVCD